MLELAFQLVAFGVVLAVVAVILQAALVPRFHFVIQINGDELKVAKGKVAAEFLDNAREVCRDFKITSGWIGGVRRGKSITLRFSGNIPPQCRQRLRNVWFCP